MINWLDSVSDLFQYIENNLSNNKQITANNGIIIIKDYNNDNDIVETNPSGIWYVTLTKSSFVQSMPCIFSWGWNNDHILLSSQYTYENMLFIFPTMWKFCFTFQWYEIICQKITLR